MRHSHQLFLQRGWALSPFGLCVYFPVMIPTPLVITLCSEEEKSGL